VERQQEPIIKWLCTLSDRLGDCYLYATSIKRTFWCS